MCYVWILSLNADMLPHMSRILIAFFKMMGIKYVCFDCFYI